MKKLPGITFPQQFEDEIRTLIGNEFDLFKASFEGVRQKSIRLNRLKFKAFHNKKMEIFNLTETGLNNDTYFVDVTQPLGQFPYYHAGLYYPQEASASYVVESMGLKPTDWVLDCCGAPGGKSTQILSKLNDGLLIANEINFKRISALVENIHRFGSDRVIITNNKVSDLMSNIFDHVLLDAPCTGEGMIKRFPELVHTFSMKNILKAQQLQIQLFEDAIDKVKDGGFITYSTCTFNRYENEFVIEEILRRYPNCDLITLPLTMYSQRGVGEVGQSCLRFYPHLFGEGHFIAKIQVFKHDNYKHKIIKKKNIELKNQTFEMLIDFPDLSKVNPVVVGKPLTSYGKPHWAFPLLADTVVSINCDLLEAYQYLNGQVLNKKTHLQGYQVIGIDDVGLGWVKISNQQLKNHYPKIYRNRFSKPKK